MDLLIIPSTWCLLIRSLSHIDRSRIQGEPGVKMNEEHFSEKKDTNLKAVLSLSICVCVCVSFHFTQITEICHLHSLHKMDYNYTASTHTQ